ncbi:MAG: hypothetical protein HQL21_04255 [Candidatus Omnitrophica bacterium]|nr:hypothetical protein [Candidatus Omnitrophota bacterium]
MVSSNKELDFRKVMAFSQVDRIVVTMVLTCSMPFMFHAIPLFSGPEWGMRWLPMFYAPLIASLLFRPHVSLIVGVGAPLINHALLGMPDSRVLPGLIFELVVLNAILVLISKQRQMRGMYVVPVFIGVRILSLLIFSKTGEGVSIQLAHSLLVAWPGVIMLALLAEIMGRVVGRDNS